MLSTRILTALVALAVVLGALFLLPLRAFALVVLAIMAAAAHEWTHLARFGQAARAAFVVLCSSPVAAARSSGPTWDARRRELAVGVAALATLFWVLVATPWVVLRWPPRSPVALAVCGWVVLDRRLRRARRAAGALAVARARGDGHRLDRGHRGVLQRARVRASQARAAGEPRARRGKACSARSSPWPSIRSRSCRWRAARATRERSKRRSIAAVARVRGGGRGAVGRRRSLSSPG
jgi:hypothetical protein